MKLTDQGSKLSFGDSGTVIYEPSKGRGSVLELTVKKVQQGSLADFTGFILDDAYKKKASYFYATVTVKNVGEGDVGGVPVPLWGVNEKNVLLPAVNFTTSFKKCPSKPLPKSFGTGKSFSTCLVYLAPNKGKLEGVSYRPSQEFNPITWTGTIEKPAPPKKKSEKKSDEEEAEEEAGPVTGPVPRELRLGSLRVDTPVVLAPMAGITNAAYRRLCREQGAGLYVGEMTTSRGIVERDETTLRMLVFDEAEDVRSVQLYGTDPVYVGKATEILCAEYGVAHVDLNFGCPVPKVTRKGGGGALPWKRRLLGEILEAAVRAAAPYDVPVTMKTRMGIDAEHLTFLDAGRIAQDTGCAAIALHARTVDQAYSGRADWTAIAELVAHVDIPVLGNGDIWEAADALRMVRETGAAGVVVGRGCLGRPWLFRDLATAFAGRQTRSEERSDVSRRGQHSERWRR